MRQLSATLASYLELRGTCGATSRLKPAITKLPTFFAMLLVSASASAGYIDTVTGRSWMEPSDLQGASWNQLAGVCSASTGVCNGSLKGVDLTGWTWASRQDVRGLFVDLGIPLSTGNAYFGPGTNATWAPPFIDLDGAGPDAGAFAPTFSASNATGVLGWTRDSDSDSSGYFASVIDYGGSSASNLDSAQLSRDQPRTTSVSSLGAFVYREAASLNEVPEPSSVALILGALVGLVVARRKAAHEGSAASLA